MVEGIENIIVSLYEGMGVSNIEQQIREIYNFDVLEYTISHITKAVTADIIFWQNHSLESILLIVWMESSSKSEKNLKLSIKLFI